MSVATTSPQQSATVTANAGGAGENTIPTTIINNPVIERIVETTRLITEGGISPELLEKKINELDGKLSARLSSLSAANSTQVSYVYAAAASVGNIDHLKSVDLETPTIRGGSITNTTVSAKSLAVTGTGTSTAANGFDISDGCFAIDGVCISGSGGGSSFRHAWELLDGVLSATTSVPILVNNATSTITNLVMVNATTTNATTTTFAIGSLTGPLQALSGVVSATSTLSPAYGGTGNSTFSIGDILYASAAGTLSRLSVGSTGQVLKVAAGLPSWGADAQGSGGAGAWATSTDNLALYPTDTSQVVLVGQSATSTTNNILEVLGNTLFRGNVISYYANTAPYFTATSTTASIFPYASTTAFGVSGTFYADTASTTNLTISSLGTPAGTFLAVNPSGVVIATTTPSGGGSGTVTSITAGSGLSGGTITTSGTVSLDLANSNTWTALQLFAAGASTTNFSNVGTAYFGSTATTTINSSGDLLVAGSTTLQNFTGINATSTNATTTAFNIAGTIMGAGLSSCSGSSDKLIWNATTHQFGCGADAGAGGGITALGAQYSSFQSGSSQTFATSSDTNLLLTITSSGDTHTFTPSWTGTLAVDRGGTGAATLGASQLLYGNGTGAVATVATSSLAAGTGLTVSGGSLGYQIGGSTDTLALANIAANSVLANVTGSAATPTELSTS